VATAALIAPKLAATLALSPGAERNVGSSHEGYVRWWWVLVAGVAGIVLAVAGAVLIMVIRRRGAADV
jgi:ABC-type Fe3+-siderophore transport system permease subunit